MAVHPLALTQVGLLVTPRRSMRGRCTDRSFRRNFGLIVVQTNLKLLLCKPSKGRTHEGDIPPAPQHTAKPGPAICRLVTLRCEDKAPSVFRNLLFLSGHKGVPGARALAMLLRMAKEAHFFVASDM